jgi:hypothetical protein
VQSETTELRAKRSENFEEASRHDWHCRDRNSSGRGNACKTFMPAVGRNMALEFSAGVLAEKRLR